MRRKRFRESRHAHRYLDGLKGVEIGGSIHNPFGLDTINVDYTDSTEEGVYKRKEVEHSGEMLKVDVVASGDDLPFADNSFDFVLSSHVIEHFFDPIKALKEWYRVVRDGGYIYAIVPHKDRTFDRERPRTGLEELIARHEGAIPRPEVDHREHWSVWTTADFLRLCNHLGFRVVDFLDCDDKARNGFTVVIKKYPGHYRLNGWLRLKMMVASLLRVRTIIRRFFRLRLSRRKQMIRLFGIDLVNRGYNA